MPITTTGWDGTGGAHPNSCRVNIEIGDALTALMDAIEAFITTHGWELYDAAAGTNARAYKMSFLPDTLSQVAYGYIVLDGNTSGYLMLKCYEGWNPTTHTGTNLATNSGTAALYNQQIPANTIGTFTVAGWIKIQSSQFGLYLLGYNGASTGTTGDNGPTFVTQLSRTCAEDTTILGYSKIIWGCTYSLFSITSAVNHAALSHPRSRFGNTLGGKLGVFSDCGSGGFIKVSGGTHGDPNSNIMPAFSDSITGKLRYSNLRVEECGSAVNLTASLGTTLDVILFTVGQGVANIDDITFTATDDAEYGGAAFVAHDGTVHTWWVLGGTIGRLAVRK